jgi:hypothetical protein
MYDSINSDDLGEVVGEFHGVPVRAWDKRSTRKREADYLATLTANSIIGTRAHELAAAQAA